MVEKRVLYAVVLALFAALLANGATGNPLPGGVNGPAVRPAANTVDAPAILTPGSMWDHGPTFPPDPWEDRATPKVAHGPTFPPDPWEDGGTPKLAPGLSTRVDA